jgi:hypothetical protein
MRRQRRSPLPSRQCPSTCWQISPPGRTCRSHFVIATKHLAIRANRITIDYYASHNRCPDGNRAGRFCILPRRRPPTNLQPTMLSAGSAGREALAGRKSISQFYAQSASARCSRSPPGWVGSAASIAAKKMDAGHSHAVRAAWRRPRPSCGRLTPSPPEIAC